MKTFKHPKLRIESISDLNQDLRKYCVRFSDIDHWNWFGEQELLALWFEEVKENHFWNWMISWLDSFYVNTTRDFDTDWRIDSASNCDDDWSSFQTKEQAQQFDKMMMTIWKIWKWKKENDTEWWYYTLNYSNYKKIYYIENIDSNYYHDFFLPRFSSKEKVDQLISDIGEEELNNLLCWIK